MNLNGFSKLTLAFLLLWFFLPGNIYGQQINNNSLRFGASSATSSINSAGNLLQPFYYDEDAPIWRKLTYSTYALDSRIGVGGDGTAEWNVNGFMELNPTMSGQSIDTSNFTSNGGTSSGTLVVSGTITIGSTNFELINSYTLLNSKYIKIVTTLTNKGTSTATNVRYWVGTRDDFIGSTDEPKKERGNIENSSFELITATSQRSRALKVSSGDEGVLFFTTYPNANTAVKRYASNKFEASDIDPSSVPIITVGSATGSGSADDSSYALFVRMNDLALNESDSFTWYYAASPIAEFDDFTNDIYDDTYPTVELTDNHPDNILIRSDSVTVTATFSKAMTATPSVEIDGSILPPTPMTATASSSVWVYTMNVNSLFSSDGTMR